jgi:hypothetical protein
MGLSNENQNPQTQVSEAYAFELAAMRAKFIADKLIVFEHNPDPKELPHPASLGATRIRTVSTLIPLRVHVDKACADHNSRVSSHGAVAQWEHTWKGKS